MPGVPPDALDTMKRAFKGLFKKKKQPAPEDAPVASSSEPSSPPTATESAKPTATSPADPVPAPPLAPASETAPQEPNTDETGPAEPAPAESDATKAPPPVGPTAPVTDPSVASVAPTTASAGAPPAKIEVSSLDGAKDALPPKADAAATTGSASESATIPTSKPEPAPGMSATSGPLSDHPDWDRAASS